jgi:PAS domain S-box-containing protein
MDLETKENGLSRLATPDNESKTATLQAACRSEERLRAIFNQASVGMAIASLDGVFEEVNVRFCEILGYEAKDLIGKTILEFTVPEDAEKTRENIRQLLAGEIENYAIEKRFRRKQGDIIWTLTSVTMLKDSEGRAESFIGAIEDITDRKKAEAAVREGAQRFQLALQAGHLGEWSWDPKTDIVTTGPKAAEFLGIPPGAAMTWTNIRELLYAPDRERTRRAVEEALANHTDYDIEYRIHRGNQLVWIAAKGRGIYGPDGSVTAMIGLLQDVTERKTAELNQSRLAAVVESSDDAILSLGLDTIITTWNRGAERMFGYTAAEAVGKSVSMLIPPESEDEEPRIVQRILDGDRVDHYDTIRMRKDGVRLNISLTVSPIYNGAGEIVGVSKIARDITDWKQVEVSRSRLAAVVESSDDAIISMNLDTTITSWNQGAERTFGYTAEEAIGKSVSMLIPPDSEDEEPKILQRILNGERVDHYETVRMRKDGTLLDVSLTVSPVLDSAGNIRGVSKISRDITEKKRAEAALREETRILELLNSTGKAIASQLSLEGVVQTVTDSATKLIGAKFGAFFYTVKNEAGETMQLFTLSGAPAEAFAKFGHPRATPLFGPTFIGGAPVRADDVTKDPRYGQFGPHYGMPKGHLPVRSYLGVPVVSRTGEVIGGLFFGHPDAGVFTERSERLIVGMAAQAAIAIDNARLYDAAQKEIKERKKVEEALRGAQEELRRHAETLEEQVADRTARLRETIQELEAFSYSVSHDMRSPLRAMQGYSDALLEDHSQRLDETAQDYLKRIRRAASRMDLLIQDVLAYSRVAKGDIDLQPVDVEHVIADVIQHYPALEAKNADIRVVGPIPKVVGHEAYLTQIVSNLLSNAVKFVPAGTRPAVEIRAKSEGEMVRIIFKDNGIGIAPEHQKQIFQIFGRVYSEKKFEGTGIGLAIAKKAAERMGGAVGVESTMGQGSEFFVILKGAQ